MKRKLVKGLILVAAIVVCAVVAAALIIPRMNTYQEEGTLKLAVLKKPVKVVRDEKGMAYLRAENFHDAIAAQGFITAQDRLFQMQLTRMMAQGRISELAGEKAKPLDIRMRTIGMHRLARKHEKILDQETRNFFQSYVDGVNAFVKSGRDLHLEFSIAGLKPDTWTIADSLSVLYYMAWTTSGNMQTEIVAQMLVEKLGLEKAREIFPINVNPDDPSDTGARSAWLPESTQLHLASDHLLRGYLDWAGPLQGSNNWSVAGRLSTSGKPIVADDPHLDARILPGVWYPLGLITPEFRAVGVMVPGIPGMAIGRTDHIALGVTNAYGDCQDLYVETLDPKDPNKYMEGAASQPFEVVKEKLRIKDKAAPSGYREEEFSIRFTKRGPVVSGVLPGLRTNKVITLRWAANESMEPKIRLMDLLSARSVDELQASLSSLTMIVLNYVFADKQGNVGWLVSGRLPIRSQGESLVPYEVRDAKDNWVGWIPQERMPQSRNPANGWVGTCNHKTTRNDYPYYYSNHLSPSYRYRRLKELLGDPTPKKALDHWAFQRDTDNLMARDIAPIMSKALLGKEETRKVGEVLASWNARDDLESAAPTVFQGVYRNFARLVYEDELGADLASLMLESWYFWEERLHRMVKDGNSPWFDDIRTKDKQETMNDLFQKAAVQFVRDMSSTRGSDPAGWLWGQSHRLEFVNPLRRDGFGKGFLGGGSHPMGGSGETLYRAIYSFNDSFAVTNSASLRMVADLGDDEKVLGVLPAGVTGRTLHPHARDQIVPFMRGDAVYWWFSDEAIRKNTKASLTLTP
ncbi:MAG: penicillin acylase family protein [Thermodesulfobacteriota bacterium]